tara:strand:+ start:51 stop:326 length:276 start_codon:yes stop_codon:yes gene_type:complete
MTLLDRLCDHMVRSTPWDPYNISSFECPCCRQPFTIPIHVTETRDEHFARVPKALEDPSIHRSNCLMPEVLRHRRSRRFRIRQYLHRRRSR